jgi:small subunit ribosomal protein S16
VSVRIRMKQFGRKHRPYYRICAMDIRRPRDGRVLEELGTYDPLVPETDARALLNGERINYWLSVGAQPSDTVSVLIKKYGVGGTHIAAQQAAIARLAESRRRPEPMAPLPRPPKPMKKAAEEEEAPKRRRKGARAEAPAAEAPVAEVPVAEAPVAEAPAAEEPAKTEETATENQG